MRFVLLILLAALPLFAFDKDFIMSDSDYTNPDAPRSAYLKTYAPFIGSNRVIFIYGCAMEYHLNPTLLFMTAQKESSQWGGEPSLDIDNYFLGCQIHIDRAEGNHKNKSFEAQVVGACSRYRWYYDNAARYHYRISIYADLIGEVLGERITVLNAATFGLYMYTPYYRFEYKGQVYGNCFVPGIMTREKKRLGVN